MLGLISAGIDAQVPLERLHRHEMVTSSSPTTVMFETHGSATELDYWAEAGVCLVLDSHISVRMNNYTIANTCLRLSIQRPAIEHRLNLRELRGCPRVSGINHPPFLQHLTSCAQRETCLYKCLNSRIVYLRHWELLTTVRHQHGSQVHQPPTSRLRVLRHAWSIRRSPRKHPMLRAYTHVKLTSSAGDTDEPVELPDGVHEHVHRDAVHHRADDDGSVHDGD